MADVFISYSKADAAWTTRVADALRACGLTVWWDTSGLAPGGEFSAEIERQLDAARFVVVLWSKTSARSEWVRDEADHAKRQGKLVSAIIDDLPLPPIGFRQRHAPSLKTWRGDARDPLFRPVLDAVGAVAPADTPPALRSEPQVERPANWMPARIGLAGCFLLLALVRILPNSGLDFFDAHNELAIRIWSGEILLSAGLAALAAASVLLFRPATMALIAAAFALTFSTSIDNIAYLTFGNQAVAAENESREAVRQSRPPPQLDVEGPVEAADEANASALYELAPEVQSKVSVDASIVAHISLLFAAILVVLVFLRRAWAWWLLSSAAAGAVLVDVLGQPEFRMALYGVGEVAGPAYLLIMLTPLVLVSVSAYVASKRGVLT